jgi:hypothetical protein
MLKMIFRLTLLSTALIIQAKAQETSTSTKEAFLKINARQLLKENANLIFNGNMELGETGKPCPGFLLRAYLTPELALKKPENIYAPITKTEKDGNNYLFVKGTPGLPEYDLQSERFYIDKACEAELTFRIKYLPCENGEFYEGQKTTLDFRCFNHKVTHGPVHVRYPVLFARGFKPSKEWKKYSYKVKLKPGFLYQLWFRRNAGSPEKNLNGLCVDDVKLKFPAGAEVAIPQQIVAIPNKSIPAYTKKEKVSFQIRALLDSGNKEESVNLHIRQDFSKKLIETLNVKLVSDDSTQKKKRLFTGSCELTPQEYGSFNSVLSMNGKALFAKGGDFAIIHKLPAKTSSLQQKIGGHMNMENLHQQLKSNNLTYCTKSGIGARCEVAAKAGIKTAYFHLAWKKVEPEKGKFRNWIINGELKLFKEYGITPLGVLGSVFFRLPSPEKYPDKIKGNLPTWIYLEFSRTRKNKSKIIGGRDRSVMPGKEAWQNYLDYVVKNYGDKLNLWAVMGEPQWGFNPEEYFELQKMAYQTVKKSYPDDIVIAGDGTSDFGHKLVTWLAELHKLGFEDYLDYVAFNPYGSALDSQKGQYFRFSNLIDTLRKELKPGTRLWLQECFYLPSSKFKQGNSGTELALFGGGDIQRHYLNAFLCGLEGMSSITEKSLCKQDKSVPMNAVPSETFAGINSLSYMLRDMESIKALKLNKFLRSGVFVNKENNEALGFIWDLKGKGTTMVFPAGAEKLEMLDCFGNTIEAKEKLELTLDPIYIKGSPETVEKLLTESKYDLGSPIALRVRKFMDSSYIEAQNKTGTSLRVKVDVNNNAPKLRYTFQNKDFKTVPLKGVELKENLFSTQISDEEPREGKFEQLKSYGEYTIGTKVAPLKLKTDKDSELELWTENGMLWIKAKVNDNKIVASPDGALYKGDALEVFIDREPFYRMDIDDMSAGSEKIAMKQYIFAAKPNSKGKKVMLIDKRKGEVESKSINEIKTTENGYEIKAGIPLSEISPVKDSGNIIGMNFEIGRHDGTEKSQREYFSAGRNPSYKHRLHYPLFMVPAFGKYIRLENSGFEKGTENWSSFQKSIIPESAQSANEKACVKIEMPEKPNWGPRFVRGSLKQNVELAPGKYKVGGFIKAKNLYAIKMYINGKDSNGKQISVRKEIKDLPTLDAWERYEVELDIPEKLKNASFYISFLGWRDKECIAFLDDAYIMTLESNKCEAKK